MMPRVLVTGARGFLGRHLMPLLEAKYGASRVVGVSRQDYDLMDPVQVDRMFTRIQPDAVVHLAAYSGGIGANRAYPADFYYQNTLLTALTFEAAARHKVRKLIYTMGGCSYPASATSPIDEGQMWNGFPQPDSAGYSSAKKMGLVASATYRQQHGLNSVVLIPGNAYGEYDNFRTADAHVIPAMIRRLVDAKRAGSPSLPLWGSGEPVRDFVYAGDVAAAMLYFLDHYDSSEPVNISSGTTTSIRELADLLRQAIGYEGAIVWDTSKPDGQRVKIFDVTRLHGLGLRCATPLGEGLRRTVDWFLKNHERAGDGIRL